MPASDSNLSLNTRGVIGFLSNPYYLLLVFLVTVMAGVWAGVYFYLQSTKEQVFEIATRDRMNLARAFSEEVKASVRGIDLSLLALREKWRSEPEEFDAAVRRQQNYFAREVGFQFAVLNADGLLVYSNLDQGGSQPLNLADREHFRIHRERHSDELFISKPLLGRVSNRWSIQFTRPILGERGEFLGVLVMSVAPDYFARFYAGLNLGEQSVIALVRSSGDMLARSPQPELALGKRLDSHPFLQPEAPDTGSFQRHGQIDGIERIYSWRTLDEFGLIVIVGETVGSALAPYYRQRDVFVLAAAGTTGLLAVFAFFMMRGLRRRMRVINALKRSEERNRLRVAALEAVGNAVMITNTDAEIEWVNRAFETLTGYSKEEAFGRRPADLIASGRQNKQYYEGMWQAISAGKTWRGELINRRKDGSMYDEELVIAPVKTSSGQVTHYVGVKQDISERKRNEKALRDSEERWKFALEGAGDAVWELDLTNGSMRFSKRLYEMLGMSEAEIGSAFANWSSFVVEEDLARMQADVQAYLDKRTSAFVTEHRVRCKDGAIKWLLVRGMVASRDASGKALSMIGTQTDITERKLVDEELRVAAAAFELQEGMMVTDAQCNILRVNQAFETLTGYSAEEVIGKNPSILRSGRQNGDFYRHMWGTIRRTGHWEGEIWNRRKNGELYPEWLVISAVKDQAGDITHYVGAFSDITTRKEAEAQIRNLAFYDPLTNLPNRRLLHDRVTQALSASARTGRHGALMLIDLDHFKTLNDTLGHDVGDQLLIQVARRLTSAVRECDTVARLGGDEFVVMLQDLHTDETVAAGQIETVAAKLLAALNQPYLLKESGPGGYRTTPSIGISQFRGHEQAFDILFKQADIALYQAKDAGRNTVRFYSAEMQATLNEKAALEAGLREALANGGFHLHYQPQVDQEGRIVGAEGLLRWQPPGQPMVPPPRFIPLAEETGLIVQIGQWVLEEACAQLAAWAGDPRTAVLEVSVNVSARQFRQPKFVDTVKAALARSGANPARLKLELTESAVLNDVEDAVDRMRELRALGITFALDDFGTGYSSLSYLKLLPLDQLKIDKSFVRDIATDAEDAAIVKTIISMSDTLGLQVIAEGVETAEQLAFLKANNCRHYQGYLFGKPEVPEVIERLVIDADRAVA